MFCNLITEDRDVYFAMIIPEQGSKQQMCVLLNGVKDLLQAVKLARYYTDVTHAEGYSCTSVFFNDSGRIQYQKSFVETPAQAKLVREDICSECDS